MMAYNRNLNGLRGLLALCVFLRHVWGGPRLDGWWGQGPPDAAVLDFLFDSLQCAVEVFFMISGFLITASLLRAPSAGQFILHRLLRIYPVFLATHLLLFALGPMLHYKLLDGIGFGAWLWLFVTNGLLLPGLLDLPLVQTNAWSLSYEAGFYGFALLALKLPMPPGRWWRAGLVTLAAAGICYVYPRAVFFAAGAVVYLASAGARRLGRSRLILPWLLLPALFLVLEAGLEAQIIWTRALYGIGACVGIAVFAAILYGRGLAQRLLSSGPMQALGDISYSFYLWHPFAYFAAKGVVRTYAVGLAPAWQVGLLFLLALPISLLVAWASYRSIECRATDALRRWLLPRPSCPSSAPASN